MKQAAPRPRQEGAAGPGRGPRGVEGGDAVPADGLAKRPSRRHPHYYDGSAEGVRGELPHQGWDSLEEGLREEAVRIATIMRDGKSRFHGRVR